MEIWWLVISIMVGIGVEYGFGEGIGFWLVDFKYIWSLNRPGFEIYQSLLISLVAGITEL